MTLKEKIDLLALDINEHGTQTSGSKKMLDILNFINGELLSHYERIAKLESDKVYTAERG